MKNAALGILLGIACFFCGYGIASMLEHYADGRCHAREDNSHD